MYTYEQMMQIEDYTKHHSLRYYRLTDLESEGMYRSYRIDKDLPEMQKDRIYYPEVYNPENADKVSTFDDKKFAVAVVDRCGRLEDFLDWLRDEYLSQKEQISMKDILNVVYGLGLKNAFDSQVKE